MKTLIKSSVFILLLFLIVYFSGSFVLKKVAEKTVTELKPELEKKGVIVENFDYENILLNSYNSFAITGVDLDFYLNKKLFGKESFKAEFNAKSITVRFADFSRPSFFFTIEDFTLLIEPDEDLEIKPFGKLENGYLKTRIPLYLKTPEESGKEILAEIKTLFRDNRTPMDLEFIVDVLLTIDEKEVKAKLFTQRDERWTYLKFDENDILNAALKFEIELSEKEAEIIANYPSKVPEMIKITRDAKKLSEHEKERDPSFPEDAYKHIYWSYHLTQAFGPEFAKEITDAHETNLNNTENEHKMDFHNNKVGRKYADENITASQLRNRVLNSKEVIRDPGELR